jgi:hypothetical protein
VLGDDVVEAIAHDTVPTDPSFGSRLHDVAGLYVNPPAAAAVFCFDEKTQVQALDRTQPSLPMVPGRAGTITHDHKGNGTPDLFAAKPVRNWLAHNRRRRWHLHFTPASSSWLNPVECWLSVLSRKALTDTSFTSVAELETRIDWWVSHWNDNPEPFVWTKPADEIPGKVAHGQATLDRITKSATYH